MSPGRPGLPFSGQLSKSSVVSCTLLLKRPAGRFARPKFDLRLMETRLGSRAKAPALMPVSPCESRLMAVVDSQQPPQSTYVALSFEQQPLVLTQPVSDRPAARACGRSVRLRLSASAGAARAGAPCANATAIEQASATSQSACGMAAVWGRGGQMGAHGAQYCAVEVCASRRRFAPSGPQRRSACAPFSSASSKTTARHNCSLAVSQRPAWPAASFVPHALGCGAPRACHLA